MLSLHKPTRHQGNLCGLFHHWLAANSGRLSVALFVRVRYRGGRSTLSGRSRQSGPSKARSLASCTLATAWMLPKSWTCAERHSATASGYGPSTFFSIRIQFRAPCCDPAARPENAVESCQLQNKKLCYSECEHFILITRWFDLTCSGWGVADDSRRFRQELPVLHSGVWHPHGAAIHPRRLAIWPLPGLLQQRRCPPV